MKKTSIAALRNNLSSLLEYVQKGKELEIEKRNVPIARIIPIETPLENQTKLGTGIGTVKFMGDVTESILDEDWEMYQ